MSIEQDGVTLDAQGRPLSGTCPCCGQRLTAAVEALGDSKARPEAGDVTLCVYCLSPLVFNEDMSLREADLNDMMKLSPGDMQAVGKEQEQLRQRKANKQ